MSKLITSQKLLLDIAQSNETCLMCDVDINECEIINGFCEQTCENLPGSYRCRCLPGYDMNTDNRTCNGNHHVFVDYL